MLGKVVVVIKNRIFRRMRCFFISKFVFVYGCLWISYGKFGEFNVDSREECTFLKTYFGPTDGIALFFWWYMRGCFICRFRGYSVWDDGSCDIRQADFRHRVRRAPRHGEGGIFGI